MTGSLNVGPRVLMSRSRLRSHRLAHPGQPRRRAVSLQTSAHYEDPRGAQSSLKDAFREGLIADYTEAHPLIEQGLRQSTTFLSLVSLVALVIGALGVATAIQAHLQQKMDSIAVMKCLGAKSSQVLRIYILQTTGLGLVGAWRDCPGQPGANGLSDFPRTLFSNHVDSALRCVVGAAGAARGSADRPAVHGAAASGDSLHPAGADFPARDGGAPAIAWRMVEASSGHGDFGDSDPGLRGRHRGMAQRQRANGPVLRIRDRCGYAGAGGRGVAAAAGPAPLQPAYAAARRTHRPSGHRESVSPRQSRGRGGHGAGSGRHVHGHGVDRAARLAAGYCAHRAARHAQRLSARYHGVESRCGLRSAHEAAGIAGAAGNAGRGVGAPCNRSTV